MNPTCSRRSFVRTSLIAGAALTTPIKILASTSVGKPAFPVADYHVHLNHELSIDQAVKLGKERQFGIGIVDHPGPGYKIQNDADLAQYIDGLRQHPVRIGQQPVYAGWSRNFSKNALDQLDYVLMDVLTLPRPDGDWQAIWQIDTMVDDG